jgi:hypothetical protein
MALWILEWGMRWAQCHSCCCVREVKPAFGNEPQLYAVGLKPRQIKWMVYTSSLASRKRNRGEASLVVSLCEIPSLSRSDGSAYFSSDVSIISILTSEGAITDTKFTCSSWLTLFANRSQSFTAHHPSIWRLLFRKTCDNYMIHKPQGPSFVFICYMWESSRFYVSVQRRFSRPHMRGRKQTRCIHWARFPCIWRFFHKTSIRPKIHCLCLYTCGNCLDCRLLLCMCCLILANY